MLLSVLFATVQLGQVSPPRNWLIEVEVRDSPVLISLELDESGAKVRRQNQFVRGVVAKTGEGMLTITFKNNFLVGAGEMKLKVGKEFVEGTLNTNLCQENVRGTLAPKSPPKPSTKPALNGPGFQGLDIPKKLVAAKTAGTSIARIADGKVVEVGFFGVENAFTGEPVTENTRFQAGGMGSVFTCLAALKLAGQGKLDLTTPVSTILPSLKLAPKDGKEIRVLDLLRGSSGLDQYKFRGYRQSETPPSLLQLLQGADVDQLNALEIVKPIGEQTGFKGINHAVLQAVLEAKTGKPFAPLMQDLLLRPLGMSHSTFELRPRVSKRATLTSGHYETGEPLLFGDHIYPTLGDSGLWTTAPDIAKAFIEAGRLLAGKPNKFLAPEKQSLLALVDGPMGVASFIRGDADTYFHGGDTYGQFCNFALHPHKGTGVIVLTNRVMNWRFVGQVIDEASK